MVPGPNVLLIVATSLARGRLRGLQTVAGTTTAMALQLLVAALGTAWFAAALSQAFGVLRWLGVAYLVYLGVTRLRQAIKPAQRVDEPDIAASCAYWRGFLVSITNPKTILFFGAFLPQFTSASLPYGPQVVVLSVTFLVLAAVLDSCYAVAAGAVSALARRPLARRWSDGIAGTLYIGSGVGLALARRA